MRFSPTLFLSALGLSALALAAPGDDATKTNSGVILVKHCLVGMKDKVKISATEAGQLVELGVDDGSVVEKGDVMGKLDDSDSHIRQEAAQAELEVAQEQATSDVNIRAAEKMADVAKAEWDQAIEINRKTPGAVSETEVRRLKLTYERGLLQIEVAKLEKSVAEKTAKAKEAAVKAAVNEIRKRKIVAPLDAIVDHVMTEEGEFLQPGQPVIELVRVDKLRVEAFLNASEFSPHEVEGQDVIIEITVRDPKTKAQKVEQFRSKIMFVSKQIVADGAYRISTDFDNRKLGDNWVVWPGLNANLKIQVGGTPATTVSIPVEKPPTRFAPPVEKK